MADFVTDQGDIPWADAAAWWDDIQRLGRGGRYFFSLNRYLFKAVKPRLSEVSLRFQAGLRAAARGGHPRPDNSEVG
jgi:hypothetical protein